MDNLESGKEVVDVEQQMVVEGRKADIGKVSFGGNSSLLDVHYMDTKMCDG